MSYQQYTRFRTTVNFDRKYLWTGLSNRQAKTRAAVGMEIPMGIPMGMGMVWVWGL